MLESLLHNPAFLIGALVVSIVFIAMNIVMAASIMRGRKDKIDEAFNRDKKAMDELHQRVEELKKNDRA